MTRSSHCILCLSMELTLDRTPHSSLGKGLGSNRSRCILGLERIYELLEVGREAVDRGNGDIRSRGAFVT